MMVIINMNGKVKYPISSEVILTHSGWVMHIYVSKLTTIGSDNG